jgi:hypothetical protein
MTYADVNFGFETMATCILMVPFSIFFHYAYNVAPYDLRKPKMLPLSEIPPMYLGADAGENEAFNQSRHMAPRDDHEGQYYGGFLGWKAWIHVLDPREILQALVFAFTMRKEANRRKRPVSGAGVRW